MSGHVAVLGGGNWGTTLAHLAAVNGREVRLWSRNDAICREIVDQHRNPKAVPGLAIDHRVTASTRLAPCVEGAELVLVVIPAQSFREVVRVLGDHLTPQQVVVHATKGIELGSHRRMSEILGEETCARAIGVLAGPNIAREIAAGDPAGTVIASRFPRVITAARRALGSPRLMMFRADDVIGVELAGALKNVVAVAAGMATAMGLGENSKAFLIARGLAEITALSCAMGARPGTFAGLAGLGDLIATCTSRDSRNHRVGAALAGGATLQQALDALGMVAEGVPTAVAASELAVRHHIETPLFERVRQVLHAGLAPREALDQLLALRPGRDVPWA
jgi:glycerol-3-phosphate dehydrogenase (NAD(P)+)